MRAQTESYRNTTPRASSPFQSIKSRREIERKHCEGDVGKQCSFLTTTVHFIYSPSPTRIAGHIAAFGAARPPPSRRVEGWVATRGGNPHPPRPSARISDDPIISRPAGPQHWTINVAVPSVKQREAYIVLLRHWHETLKFNKWNEELKNHTASDV